MKNGTNWIRAIARKLCYLIYLLVVVFILLEVIFRILPTNSPIDLQVTSEPDEILKFYPNQKTTFALGANFYQVVEKKTNNYGFYSSYDYYKDSKPDIAIIGDSFVEAAQIKNQDSLGEILNAENKNLLVYQLGVSGVTLSQYLMMLRYADREFAPKHFVVVVVGNDFDESLINVRHKEGTWGFDGDYNLKFKPFTGYQGLRELAKNSAFMRYLVFQVGINWRQIVPRVGIAVPHGGNDSKFAGNTERRKSNLIVKSSQKVISCFFKELVKMNLINRVTLVIDADRMDIYQKRISKSFFNQMRKHLIKCAEEFGVNYLDLDKVFRDDYANAAQRFEFPTDGHWNEHAHRLSAKCLLHLLNQRGAINTD